MGKKEGELVRFGVALERGTLQNFDTLLEQLEYSNRSKAIGDLIRHRLSQEAAQKSNVFVVGVIILIYDHHQRQVDDKIVDVQHDHLDKVLSSMHVHIDHHHCMEILAIRGKAGAIRKLAGLLGGLRGVTHCEVSLTALPKKQ